MIGTFGGWQANHTDGLSSLKRPHGNPCSECHHRFLPKYTRTRGYSHTRNCHKLGARKQKKEPKYTSLFNTGLQALGILFTAHHANRHILPSCWRTRQTAIPQVVVCHNSFILPFSFLHFQTGVNCLQGRRSHDDMDELLIHPYFTTNNLLLSFVTHLSPFGQFWRFSTPCLWIAFTFAEVCFCIHFINSSVAITGGILWHLRRCLNEFCRPAMDLILNYKTSFLAKRQLCFP